MTNEFNLKEERKKVFEMFLGTPHIAQIYRIILEQDKEFIRLLKEEIGIESINPVWYKKTIDKLAGDKLI